MSLARTHIVPTGVERTFGDDEIIVSKTDLQGRITYANDVFVRVSGYEPEDLLGAPHSLIRHPDMPRAVFKLLWETLAAGREIFAYVNNLARSGDHYWVLAHVTPSLDAEGRVIGYHSNRRVPERRCLTVVTDLYATLRDAERARSDRRDALLASSALLDDILTRAGQPYEQWIWSL